MTVILYNGLMQLQSRVDLQDHQALKALQVRKAQLVLQEYREFRENLGRKVQLENKAFKVLKVFRDHQEHRGFRVLKVFRENLEHREFRENLEHKVQLESRVSKVHKAFKDQQELLVPKAFKEHQEHKEHKEFKVQLELLCSQSQQTVCQLYLQMESTL